jgi:hypothetical protein
MVRSTLIYRGHLLTEIIAGESWKSFRRAANQLLNNDNMKRLVPYQEAEVTQMMWEFANQREV